MNDRCGQEVIWATLKWNSAFEGGTGRPNECLHTSQKWTHTAPFFAFWKLQGANYKVRRFDMSPQVPPASYYWPPADPLSQIQRIIWSLRKDFELLVHAVCQTPLLMHRCFVLALNLSFRQAQIRFKNTFDAKDKGDESATSIHPSPAKLAPWADFRTQFIHLKNDWHLWIFSSTFQTRGCMSRVVSLHLHVMYARAWNIQWN